MLDAATVAASVRRVEGRAEAGAFTVHLPHASALIGRVATLALLGMFKLTSALRCRLVSTPADYECIEVCASCSCATECCPPLRTHLRCSSPLTLNPHVVLAINSGVTRCFAQLTPSATALTAPVARAG